MVLKCYHHSYLVIGFESEFVDLTVNVDYNLDIFAMVARTNELAKDIVKRKLLILSLIRWMLNKLFALMKLCFP